jgi:hypothetical protein
MEGVGWCKMLRGKETLSTRLLATWRGVRTNGVSVPIEPYTGQKGMKNDG